MPLSPWRSGWIVIILGPSLWGQAVPFQPVDLALPAAMKAPVAAADLDQDGDIDLLHWNNAFLNDGHARFTAGPAISFPAYPVASLGGDFNGDGLTDVLAVDTVSGLSLLVQAPGLSFSPLAGAFPTALPATPGRTPPNVVRIVARDLDGDGDLDLIVGTVSAFIPGYSLVPDAPVELLNNGSGFFSPAAFSLLAVGLTASSDELLTDIDGDGDPDLVVNSVTAGIATVMLLRNNGSGIFGLPTSLGTSSLGLLVRLAVGDFNGDGFGDIAGAPTPSAGTGVIWLGRAAGAPTGTTSVLPFSPTRLIAIDVTNDGRDELLASDSYSNTATVFSIATSGAIGNAIQTLSGVQVDTSNPAAETIRDLDGDGDRDIVVAAGGELGLLMNDGSGSMIRVQTRLSNQAVGSGCSVGEINGDGFVDLFSVVSSQVATAINDGAGFFTAGPTSTLPSAVHAEYLNFHAFDLDGDGDSDLYGARNMTSSFGLAGTDVILRNTGGTFTVLATLVDNGPVTVIRHVDIDNDGDQDVILGRRMATTISNGIAPPMLLLRNLGSGVLAAPTTVGGNHATYDLEIADFNVDGRPDIFQTNAGVSTTVDRCVLYLNTGTGAFTAVSQPTMSGNYSCAGDLNGDGLPDIVMDGAVWFNSGGTTFIPGPTLAQALTSPAELLDVDGDGNLDLVETPASVMFNTGGAVFGLPVGIALPNNVAPTSWVVPQSTLADVDRDGDLDVVAPGPTLFLNVKRQLALGARARPGRPASLEMSGPAGGAFLLFASAGTADYPLPPYGRVFIDPSTVQLVLASTFAPPTAAAPGTATLQVLVPWSPSLVGISVDWQMIDSSLALSNRAVTTIAGY